MLRRHILLTIALLIFSIPAQAQHDFIAAKINQKVITYSELLDRYHFVIRTSRLKTISETDKKSLLEQILEKMIDEEVIMQSAKTLNITATEEEINETVKEIATQQNQNLTQLRAFFKKNNLSFENHLRQIESEILWSKIISGVIRPRARVTEIEIREFLEQHKVETEIKRFLIAEILIQRTSKHSEQLAKKITYELKHGADFNSLAKQFSDAGNENNGEIGWVSQGDVDEKVYQEIFKLGKNGYSEPVVLGDAYHIFKVLDAKTEIIISDQNMKAAQEMLLNKKVQNMARSYLMDMRKKAFVEMKI